MGEKESALKAVLCVDEETYVFKVFIIQSLLRAQME